MNSETSELTTVVPVADGEVRKGGWILTFTGHQFWPEDPRPEDVFLEDIAHALSNLCRFTGHCTRFYSVAEHSVRLARQLPVKFQPYALLHDAAEAYVNDLARPIKRTKILEEYCFLEDRVLYAILTRFGLQPLQHSPWIPNEVKFGDLKMLMTERRDLMPAAGPEWSIDASPYPETISSYDYHTAKQDFLTMAQALGIE